MIVKIYYSKNKTIYNNNFKTYKYNLYKMVIVMSILIILI